MDATGFPIAAAPPRTFKRRIRCLTTIRVLHFVDAHGPAGSTFIADFYRMDRRAASKVCTFLCRKGALVRWFFDGMAIYALPKDAPADPDILNGPLIRGQGRRQPRTKKKKAILRT